MSKREFLISEESAQAQMDLFCDWYGIDMESITRAAKSSDSGAAVMVSTDKLVTAIRRGLVEVSEESGKDGEPTLLVKQTLSRPIRDKESIIYKEVTGNARAALKSGGDGNDTARLYQFLGILSGEDGLVFRGLKGADIGIADALGFLFLLV